MMSRICKKAGVTGYKTNHSLRATAASRLYHSGLDEQLIMERTGHRSIEGIRSYKRTNSQQQQQVSNLLNRIECTTSSSESAVPDKLSLCSGIQLHNCSQITITVNNKC